MKQGPSACECLERQSLEVAIYCILCLPFISAFLLILESLVRHGELPYYAHPDPKTLRLSPLLYICYAAEVGYVVLFAAYSGLCWVCSRWRSRCLASCLLAFTLWVTLFRLVGLSIWLLD